VRRLRRVAVAAAALALLGTLLGPTLAIAHGLVGRSDLPIPEWLFGWAAAVVMVVSFVALASLWQQPKLESDSGFRRAPDWLAFTLVSPVTEVAAGLVGVALLGVTIWSGLAGTQLPTANFAPTFIYVIFWVGLVPASVLFGDVFKAFNPWRAIARAAGFVTSRVAGPLPKPFKYPLWLGRWPAALTIFGFAWIELAWVNGRDPSALAAAALVYSGVTLLATAVFGIESWFRWGEGFSVYYNLFSRISAVEVRHGRLGFRRPLSALTRLDPVPGTIAMLVVMLGTVAFDGAGEGPQWSQLAPHIQDFFQNLGFNPGDALELAFTIGMLIGLAVIATIYVLGIVGVRTVDRRPFWAVARTYIHTLVPIAAVYVFAHYFSFLIYNGQSIAFLSSDPLGRGWDLFGTAGRAIDYGVINSKQIWYVQVGVLVAGHVSGLVLSHDRALSLYERARVATQSQYWMLAVMVGFTTFGLWLLSQANQ
jgi:uncharacterized membrane protein YjfL (UPF0719 family)